MNARELIIKDTIARAKGYPDGPSQLRVLNAISIRHQLFSYSSLLTTVGFGHSLYFLRSKLKTNRLIYKVNPLIWLGALGLSYSNLKESNEELKKQTGFNDFSSLFYMSGIYARYMDS